MEEADKTVYTNFRRTYKQLVKKKKSDFFSSITTEINSTMNNSTQFWKLISQLTPSNRVLNNIDTNEWYTYFSNLFNPDTDLAGDDKGNLNLANTPGRIYLPPDQQNELNLNFTKGEIKNSIKNLKSGKSAEPDMERAIF